MRVGVILAGAALLTAQSFPLDTLRVEGNRRISSEKILAVSGLKAGAPVSKADFDAARARLLATGAFVSAGYEYKPSATRIGYDAVFEVVEVEQLFPYRLEDLSVSDQAVRAELGRQEPLFGEQIPATPEVLSRYAQEIGQIAGAKVAGKLSSEIPGQPTIVFRPPTPRPNVAEVRFVGNEALPAALLVNALSGVAIGVPYSEPTLRLLLESSVRRVYEARGRIRVSFPKIVTERAKNVDGVVVIVTVNEGPSYSLGKVQFTGVTTDPQELQKTANLQPKDIANFDDIQDGVNRVYKQFKSKGYLRAAGHIEREVDDQKRVVDLTVTIEPGPQFVMGNLEITGLDLTSEPAIRKAWDIKPGAPFQPDYPDAFLNNIREQGVFDNLGKTIAETRIDEKTHIVDVTLHFSGGGAKNDRKKRLVF